MAFNGGTQEDSFEPVAVSRRDQRASKIEQGPAFISVIPLPVREFGLVSFATCTLATQR
jgi:hypothetical protein